MGQLVLIAHNIRSAHNVGSLLRTADGLGVGEVYLTGYTPYPISPPDKRLPHLAAKIDRAIAKTALGAQKNVAWQYFERLEEATSRLKKSGYDIVALEQTKKSLPIADFKAPRRLALIVGSEIGGLEPADLKLTNQAIEIPMKGTKESFNVAVAAAIAIFTLSDK